MLEFIIEKEDLWHRLQREKKPVLLYGMGNGAEKIMRVLEQYKVPLEGIFASDEFVRGHSFHGFRVLRFEQVLERYQEFTALIAFGVHDTPTMERLYHMAQQYDVVAPDVPVAGEGLFNMEYLKLHEAEFERAYRLLEDEQSRRVFADVINFKLSGSLHYLKRCVTLPAEAYELLHLNGCEHYLDLGAYDGDTLEEFIQITGGKYKKITALEPDPKNFKKLQKRVENLEATNVKLYNLGVWSHQDQLPFQSKAGRNSALGTGKGELTPVDSVDHLLQGEAVSYIKFDVEGAEFEAIQGAKQMIRSQAPKLMLAAYHRNDDLFRLPLMLAEIQPEYRFYLRRFPYIPAWEINLLAVKRL